MAMMGLTSQSGRLFCPNDPASDPRLHLAQALRRLPKAAPIVIMIHGYKYHPRSPVTDPHRLLYSAHPERMGPKAVSWPVELGFAPMGETDGLAIGFGWEGRPSHKISPKPFLNRFAHVYAQANRAGGHLARVLGWIAELAPHQKVDLVAHSLGARVVFCALARDQFTNLGRLILMGGAEYASQVDRVLKTPDRAPSLEVFCVRSRQNAFIDFLFESFAPRPAADDFAIGRGYEGPQNSWMNIRLDDPATLAMLSARGIGLSRPSSRKLVDHWSFYERAGIMKFYRQLLRNRRGWRLMDLKLEMAQVSNVQFETPDRSGLTTT